jgi:phosphate starvation-inducible PhoH-like protein
VSRKNKKPEPGIVIEARTPNQKRYLQLLDSNRDIVFVDGPAGTGKTYLATLHAIRDLKEGLIEQNVITRPNVDAGDPLGHLPGDIYEKMAPWCAPILDIYYEHFDASQVKQMLNQRQLVIEPLTFMRGRTFKNATIIGDEMQNATPEQMKMFLTRIGEGSRMIVTGDCDQHDRGYGEPGLRDAIRRFEARPSEHVAIHRFDVSDVVRHAAIPDVLAAYA